MLINPIIFPYWRQILSVSQRVVGLLWLCRFTAPKSVRPGWGKLTVCDSHANERILSQVVALVTVTGCRETDRSPLDITGVGVGLGDLDTLYDCTI